MLRSERSPIKTQQKKRVQNETYKRRIEIITIGTTVLEQEYNNE
jgi:hypothetical protein